MTLMAKKGPAVKAQMSVFTILLLLIALGLSPTPVAGQDAEPTPLDNFRSKNHLGLRIGAWASQGETPLEEDTDPNSGGSFRTSIKNTNLYFEFFGSLRITNALRGEFSVGTVNRGSVTIREAGSGFSDVGNLNVFPFLVKARFYPLVGTNSRIQPHIAAGGGIYYARRNVQFTNNTFYYTGLNEDSEVDLNYVLSAGLDYLVSSVIVLEAQAAYMPIKFSNELVGITDYEAIGITVGLKYLR